jgi:hypothetical protein
MAKNKGKHESDKAQRKNYLLSGKHDENTIKKLRKTLKAQPNNEALRVRLAHLEKVGVPYTRNRRATLPGSRVNLRPTIDHDRDRQRAYDRKQPRSVAPWVELLKELQQAMKPTVRYKGRRGKRNRVSQAG